MKKTLFALAAMLLTWTGATAQFDRAMVVEEGTGTWCPWCVRGIAALEHMNSRFPTTFIGIAVHAGDAMDMSDYVERLNLAGYPSCNVNRSLNSQSVGISEFEEYYSTIRSQKTWAKVTVSARLSNGSIAVDARVNYQRQAPLNIAYVICEDGVTGYPQRNAYAGGGRGVMGGFESKPATINDQVYNDVARAIVPSYDGTALSPSKNAARATTTLAVPGSVQNNARLSVVALLIDPGTGEIVNAAKCRVL